MTLDTSTSIVALVSGLFGALFSAYLSYIVRVRSKEREKLASKKAISHVNFLMLTDMMASDFFLKEFCEKILKDLEPGQKDFELSHKVATLIATKIKDIDSEVLKTAHLVGKPIISASIDSMNKFSLSQTQLSELEPDTVYVYGRYSTAWDRLKAAITVLEKIMESGDAQRIDASLIHSTFVSFRSFADAGGLLRAAFKQSAGLSDAYSFACLTRSYTAVKKDMASSFEHTSKLERAKAAVALTPEAESAIPKS